MITCKEALRKAEESLVTAEVPDAGTDAWYLFEYVTGMNRAAYFLHMEDAMEENMEAQLAELYRKGTAEGLPLLAVSTSGEVSAPQAQRLLIFYYTRIPLEQMDGAVKKLAELIKNFTRISQ